MSAVAEQLVPIVDFQGIGAVAFEPSAGFRVLAGWDASVTAQPGETASEHHRRTLQFAGVHLPARPRIPYDEELCARIHAGVGEACGDLLAKDSWYEYEFALAASGMLAYTSLPVFVDRQLKGLAVFTRRKADPFTSEQTALLAAAARPIGFAMARTLADEEIGRLRDRFREDSQPSDVRLGHAPFFGDIVGASLALRRALEDIEQVAPTDATVLITGETARTKRCSPAAFINDRSAVQSPSSRSTVRRFPKPCSPRSSSATSAGRLPAPTIGGVDVSNRRMAERYSSTKSVSSRQRCRCCYSGCCRRASSGAWAAAAPCMWMSVLSPPPIAT